MLCLNLEYYKLVKHTFNIFQNQHTSIAIYENTVPNSTPHQGGTPTCTMSPAESLAEHKALLQL